MRAVCCAQGNEQQHSSLRARVVGLMQSREEDFAPFVEDDQSFDAYTARMKKVRLHSQLLAHGRFCKAA
jgi:hypothetical protein